MDLEGINQTEISQIESKKNKTKNNKAETELQRTDGACQRRWGGVREE